MEVKASLGLHEERDRKRMRPEAMESLPEASFARVHSFSGRKMGMSGAFSESSVVVWRPSSSPKCHPNCRPFPDLDSLPIK